MAEKSTITLDVSDGIATITMNRPQTFNALTRADYQEFAEMLRVIDKRDDVVMTVWQGTGKYFCSGTDVKFKEPGLKTQRDYFLRGVSLTNTDTSRALYSHSKILVAALNGPVMGIAAAFLGLFDLIYAAPEAWLLVPFSLLGINAEGGSSVSFVDRLGVAKAKEALIFGRKIPAEELMRVGFLNKIIPAESDVDFKEKVRKHLLCELENLDWTAMLASKRLIKEGLDAKNSFDATNLRESYSQADRFASGIPSARFAQIARKELRHKL
ncbi:ClpP/crotonase [Sistotremastrum niveocremeum HHB9708]|uniref:ClpP/crotonase n=2 Tax=Sistotremastraceae TaxID=3402574 RepID=A0A165AMN3_9AGAM|nr:ClpP/crotonase [Sistotremastrum niveocremeum HHB9708]KZT42120.1 ClpP/crotonase [Sistotremastrum suecicum HHB10207 ss-3]